MHISNIEINLRGKTYPVIPAPVPHIVVPTHKELHGWWPGKRECTAERMLINPYNGCSIGCFYCYSLCYPGYFQIFDKKKIITVAKDFDKEIGHQLDSINVASCGYLSPVTDPFQIINKKYNLSEKIIEEFINRNIPVELITKARISERALNSISKQKHSFVQVSILTLKENLRKILVPSGATTEGLFDNIKRARNKNIFSVARIDPIFPFITDDFMDFKQLISKLESYGVEHIIASILDIPLKRKKEIFRNIRLHFGYSVSLNYKRLYTESIDGWLNANIDYRKRIFDYLRNICDKKNLSFALCMEYELINGIPKGLNQEFSSAINCEGINIPVYKREGEKFYPAADCKGRCLFCTNPICGIRDLAMGKDGSNKGWKLKDYRRWTREIKQLKL